MSRGEWEERKKKKGTKVEEKVETLRFFFVLKGEMTPRPPDINQLMAAGPTAVTAMENLGLDGPSQREREREKEK